DLRRLVGVAVAVAPVVDRAPGRREVDCLAVVRVRRTRTEEARRPHRHYVLAVRRARVACVAALVAGRDDDDRAALARSVDRLLQIARATARAGGLRRGVEDLGGLRVTLRPGNLAARGPRDAAGDVVHRAAAPAEHADVLNLCSGSIADDADRVLRRGDRPRDMRAVPI